MALVFTDVTGAGGTPDGLDDTTGLNQADFNKYSLAFAGAPSDSEAASKAASAEALAAQVRLNAESLRLNTAMAWLQMAMGLSTKLSGR